MYYSRLKLTLVLLICSIVTIATPPTTSYGLTGADIGIYNDTAYSNGGAWDVGIEAIKAMLDSYDISYEDLSPDNINTRSDLNSLYKIIIFGGGWAGGYSELINLPGEHNIKSFVRQGGGFFGICAGSYFSASTLAWKQDFMSPLETYPDPYAVKLFSGVAKGPVLGIKTWTAPTGCSDGIEYGAAMTNITTKDVFTGETGSLNILYYGGPLFIPFINHLDNVNIIATYNVPGTPADQKPAIISFQQGLGMVCLSGPHPEISFNNCTYSYDESNWDFMYNILLMLGDI